MVSAYSHLSGFPVHLQFSFTCFTKWGTLDSL